MGHGFWVVGLVLVLAAACTGGEVICEPAPFADASSHDDALATSDGAIEVWGLFYPPSFSDLDDAPVQIEMPQPGDEGLTKVVWRATGEGPFVAEASGPDDVSIEPTGVVEHLGSNWDRPGDEWGTTWNFPQPGCWTFTITRGDDTAQISIEVLPAGQVAS